MPSADELATVPLLAALSPEARETVAEAMVTEEFPAGRRIVVEGDSGYTFFVLAEGRAAVTKGDRQLGYLEAGDYFGEIAIMGDAGRRTATVTAVTPVVAWALFGVSFRSLQAQQPGVADELRQAVAARLARG
jgi:CRP-like cAMP-binding protein